jgi:hypothetical protein
VLYSSTTYARLPQWSTRRNDTVDLRFSYTLMRDRGLVNTGIVRLVYGRLVYGVIGTGEGARRSQSGRTQQC